MPLEQFRSEINRHLDGDKTTVSHFSSWTADFQIARRFAWSEYTWNEYTPSPRYPRIGVLDTSRRQHGNTILHVRALREESHTYFHYDYEYLVYGPVTGVAYNCLSLSRRENTSVPTALRPPLYSDWSGWPVLRSLYGLSEIRKAYNRAAGRSFYHAAGAGSQGRWGSCPDTALYLTMIAAQWSQDTWNDWLFLKYSTGTEKWWQAILSDLSQVMEWAARDATLVLPLVNPLTSPDDSRTAPRSDPLRLELMFKLLLHFEAEIIRLRSKSPPEPSPAPWFLPRFLWGST